MRAGSLDQILTFQKKTIPEALDDFGNPQEVWTDDFVVHGHFESAGSKVFPTSWKRFSESTGRFIIRYQPGIDSDNHRILWIQDYNASPQIVSLWHLFPPTNNGVPGRLRETIIEAYEIK